MSSVQKKIRSTDLTIVQLTDTHLKKEQEGELLGMNTRESLDAVLELIKAHHPAPDLILATGDLAQDGDELSYRYFREKLAFFHCPVYWFAGNHDDRLAMRAASNGTPAMEKVVLTDHWQLIFLDTLVPGKVYGELAEKELEFLDQALSRHPDLHALVCFHHQPVDVGSLWLDQIGLRNKGHLFEVLDRYQQVRVVLWGHIHQEVDTVRHAVRMIATPSTCVQFLPESDDFAIDTEAPGYRWLKLAEDGTVETEVKRAHHIDFKVDYNSKGY